MANILEATPLKKLTLLQKLSTVNRSSGRGWELMSPSLTQARTLTPAGPDMSRRYYFTLSFLPLALTVLQHPLLRCPLSLVRKGYDVEVPYVAEHSINISSLCFDQLQDFVLTTTYYKSNFSDEV